MPRLPADKHCRRCGALIGKRGRVVTGLCVECRLEDLAAASPIPLPPVSILPRRTRGPGHWRRPPRVAPERVSPYARLRPRRPKLELVGDSLRPREEGARDE